MLLRNSIWNMAGAALPAITALATVPLLISALGVEGYGIVTLIAAVIGYFAVLDVNFSAGAIKFLAESHTAKDRERFAETFWFGAMFYGALGLLGATIIYFSAELFLLRFFEVSPSAREQTVTAFKIAAAGFLLTQVQNYLLVVPQALQRYDRSAQSEAFFGIFVNIASVVVAMAGGGIVGVTLVRISISSMNVLYLTWLIRQFDLHLAFRFPSKTTRNSLVSFSAYAYLSKIASTLHEHGDKLIVGALAGPVAVTFYSVPATLASRILGLTYRLSSVIYPSASSLAASERIDELRPMYLSAMRYVTYINLIALGMIVLAGDEFLQRWVGESFLEKGYPVLVLMTLALLVDSFTNIPSLVNDALGHPKVTGKFALARGLIGIGLVYIGTATAGIMGAAVAHLLASILMTACFLLFVHGRTVPISFSDAWRDGFGRSVMVGFFILAVLLPVKWLFLDGLLGTVAIVSTAVVALGIAGFMFIVSVDQRTALLSMFRRLGV
ncbi:oligosaccharide flippase family protein [Oxalobacteraceae bacterium R-40]|uniref:Oligosaccharide flippase family protein n=1 Tax=Keguizhuia sedimenti TaxID=3064264 RepID=A0ABU1BP88_9BURK|nr:oligosaccharide flippase family protein [Oxalobacteraceae bacterium R-40]